MLVAGLCVAAPFAQPYEIYPEHLTNFLWVETANCVQLAPMCEAWRVDVNTRECIGDVKVARTMTELDDNACIKWGYLYGFPDPAPDEVVFVSCDEWRA